MNQLGLGQRLDDPRPPIRYRVRRLSADRPPAEFRRRVRPEPNPADPGTLARFLAERYCLYALE